MADQTTAPVNDANPGNEETTVGTVVIPTDDGKEVTKPAVIEPAKTPPTLAGDAPVAYEPTGDVGLDLALDFVGKAGISIDHPAMKAAQEGDFSILKATLAAKGVQGWEQFVALGEAAYTRTKETEKANNVKIVSLVHEAAGGPEAWAEVQKWAAANATPEEKAEVNALLNKGGLAAKGVVQYLVGAYNRATNVDSTPADPLARAGRAGGVPTGDNAPLSPRAYSEAVDQLNTRLGGRMEGSREYAALQARRQAFRG